MGIAKRAVLEAQRRLRRKNSYDAARGIIPDRIDSDNRLAAVAAKFTKGARHHAIQAGMVDFVTAYPLSIETDPIETAPIKTKPTCFICETNLVYERPIRKQSL